MSVPVKYVLEKCQTYYETHLVDEFRTSCVCPYCDKLLSKVIKINEEGKVRAVRGLKRCSSTVCARTCFKNRDSVGAINILHCFVNHVRPPTLSRNPELTRVKLTSYLLRT